MINFDLPKNQSSYIKVLGVGGGGSNAVNHMFRQGIKGVDFIVCNTDAQALEISPVPNKIQLGSSLTEGRGAGNIPSVGKNAAIEDIDKIKEILQTNTRMLFITAGMGGGTGTGAAPVIAKVSRELSILTVGIVTIPFSFEGRKRKLQAEEGLKELKENVDSLIIICNDKLRELYGNLGVSEAFSKADNVLTTAAKGIAEIITLTGGVNVDFADVKTVMSNSGVAIMGSGYAEGENRAVKAVEMALSSPLLNDNNIKGASNILLNIISGKEEILMDEIDEITEYIQTDAGSTADIIWGYGTDESLGNKINVIVVATGFAENSDLGYEFDRKNTPKVVHGLNTMAKNSPIASDDQKMGIRLVENKAGNDAMAQRVDGGLKSNYIFDFDIDAGKDKTQNNYNPTFIEPKSKVQKSGYSEPVPKNDIGKEVEDYNIRSKIKEKEQKLKALSVNIKTAEGLHLVEKEPAYMRRNITLSNVPAGSESQLSRYTLLDGDGKVQIKSNNSFLHDNVD